MSIIEIGEAATKIVASDPGFVAQRFLALGEKSHHPVPRTPRRSPAG